jgi:8-oxo-dGTP pyrophosphatase MutT (NUDIX family)
MYRAGIVIHHPTEDAVLMVRDSRNNMWSFPKGGHESYDSSQLSTAIREVREETGFEYRKDYDVLQWLDIVDIHSYVFFRGVATRRKLLFKRCDGEYIQNVAWIPCQILQKLRMNYVSFVACQRFNLV